MTSCNVYGTQVEPLSTVVEKFFLESGNTNENHFMATMLRAARVWKDLLKNTVWMARQRVVTVGLDGTIRLPKDMQRLINISVIDEANRFQPVMYDPHMNTLLFSCRPSCTCTSCSGVDTLCDTVNAIQVRTEEIDIEGVIYTKRIWNAVCANGDFVEYTETPYYNTESLEVETVKETRLLCSLDTDENNCVKPTVDNKNKITKYCGCYLPEIVSSYCTDVTLSNGYYNIDAHDHGLVHLKDVPAKSVVVTYQSNGDCDPKEVLVPEYAIDALQHGMIYRQTVFNTKTSISDKRDAERNYEKAKTELYVYLNPLHMDVLNQLDGIIPKWG